MGNRQSVERTSNANRPAANPSSTNNPNDDGRRHSQVHFSSTAASADGAPDYTHESSTGIRARSDLQHELLQEPWPRETRPSANNNLFRRNNRLSRYLEDFSLSFPTRTRDRHFQEYPLVGTPRDRATRDRSPRRRSRLSQILFPHSRSDRDTDIPAVPEDSPRLDLDNGPPLDLNFNHDSQNFADRISSLTPARELSQWRNRRRNRERRAMRQEPSMSNILTLAAQALAATLTGTNTQSAVDDLRRAASMVDPEDASLDAFMQFLQSGRLSSHLQRSMAAADAHTDDEPLPASLDFFRMFQLRSTSTRNDIASSSTAPATPSMASAAAPSVDDVAAGEEGRLVPILIVGIRSLSHDEGQTNPADMDPNPVPHFIHSLANAQAQEAETTAAEPVEQESTPRRGRPLSEVHPRTPEARRQHWIADTGRPRSSIFPSSASEPPFLGPQPSQSSLELPAVSGSVSNQLATPSSTLRMDQPGQRASVSEAGPSFATPISSQPPARPSPHPASRNSHQRDSTASSSNRFSSFFSRNRSDDRSPSPTPRRSSRRTSGMDFLRHGSGSARRRGIIGPDRNTEGTRSWIIYVLGGNYPEDHPILSTPSLFSDSPTYEDMLMLAQLLGPAKPPVATGEDINAAGGLYNTRARQDTIEAVALEENGENIMLEDGAKTCLICLSDYNNLELIRRIKTCGHFFHQCCIDQVFLCSVCRLQLPTNKIAIKVAYPRPQLMPAVPRAGRPRAPGSA